MTSLARSQHSITRAPFPNFQSEIRHCAWPTSLGAVTVTQITATGGRTEITNFHCKGSAQCQSPKAKRRLLSMARLSGSGQFRCRLTNTSRNGDSSTPFRHFAAKRRTSRSISSCCNILSCCLDSMAVAISPSYTHSPLSRTRFRAPLGPTSNDRRIEPFWIFILEGVLRYCWRGVAMH